MPSVAVYLPASGTGAAGSLTRGKTIPLPWCCQTYPRYASFLALAWTASGILPHRCVLHWPKANVEKSVRSGEFRLEVDHDKTEARQTLEREITKQLGQPGSPSRIMNDGSVTFLGL